MKSTRPMLLGAIVVLLVFSAQSQAAEEGPAAWKHLSTVKGDLPVPGKSTQQTASLVLDVDRDGVADFVVGARRAAPSMVWYRRQRDGWTRYVIDPAMLPIEAGGAVHDVDSDGDLDVVMGEDSSGNKVYWWENPCPRFDPDLPWVRRIIKNDGAKKHHDQVFGDFDGDGAAELVFWNQRANTLFLAEIPRDVKQARHWPRRAIFQSKSESEGLAATDVDADGTLDLVGGGRWFEHRGSGKFVEHVIDDRQRFTRAAAGQLVEGGRAEVVFGPGESAGPVVWYEWDGTEWIGRPLLPRDVDHGHSLQLADVDADGNLDVFCAEMRLGGKNPEATLWLALGDGKGSFRVRTIAEGFGNHESRMADLDGDGDLDVLGKPYNWETPRLDVWLNPRQAPSQ